jgi:hypothetical protein
MKKGPDAYAPGPHSEPDLPASRRDAQPAGRHSAMTTTPRRVWSAEAAADRAEPAWPHCAVHERVRAAAHVVAPDATRLPRQVRPDPVPAHDCHCSSAHGTRALRRMPRVHRRNSRPRAARLPRCCSAGHLRGCDHHRGVRGGVHAGHGLRHEGRRPALCHHLSRRQGVAHRWAPQWRCRPQARRLQRGWRSHWLRPAVHAGVLAGAHAVPVVPRRVADHARAGRHESHHAVAVKRFGRGPARHHRCGPARVDDHDRRPCPDSGHGRARRDHDRVRDHGHHPRAAVGRGRHRDANDCGRHDHDDHREGRHDAVRCAPVPARQPWWREPNR